MLERRYLQPKTHSRLFFSNRNIASADFTCSWKPVPFGSDYSKGRVIRSRDATTLPLFSLRLLGLLVLTVHQSFAALSIFCLISYVNDMIGRRNLPYPHQNQLVSLRETTAFCAIISKIGISKWIAKD
jgi:hypothetical protein